MVESSLLDALRLRQNCRHLADGIFKLFLDANCCIVIQISVEVVSNDHIDNKSVLVQAMSCRQLARWCIASMCNFECVGVPSLYGYTWRGYITWLLHRTSIDACFTKNDNIFGAEINYPSSDTRDRTLFFLLHIGAASLTSIWKNKLNWPKRKSCFARVVSLVSLEP